jgi:molybdopterin molybdotransferase
LPSEDETGKWETMISVTTALKIIEENSFTAAPAGMLLNDAGGLVLADDLYSACDIPAFPQSSMDGYAFSFGEWIRNKRLQVKGEMAAGSSSPHEIAPDEAVRIFTGAAVPPGADTVLMQEKSKLENGLLFVADENLQAGDNVRLQGSEIKKGSLALSKDSSLTPAAIGYLAGMGFAEVPVYPRPRISIIITGNELQQPGQPLQYGQVYESNSFALVTALRQFGMGEPKKYYCTDDPGLLTGTLEGALEHSDIVLLTGGVSVGDYDFTLKATEQCGVEKLFHRIKQRPGKPVYFGKKKNKRVFGLPGNPASVLTCFYLYVLPVLEKFTGKKSSLKTTAVVSGSRLTKPAGITWFLKGNCEAGIAKTLDAQESYRLSSFARANCLIRLEEDQTGCIPGDPIDIYLLPA